MPSASKRKCSTVSKVVLINDVWRNSQIPPPLPPPKKKKKNRINMSYLIKKKETGQYSYGGDGLLKALKTL